MSEHVIVTANDKLSVKNSYTIHANKNYTVKKHES